MKEAIHSLIMHWKAQDIRTNENKWIQHYSFYPTENILAIGDFNLFYRNINGMIDLYPNYTDDKGILFYPFANVINAHQDSSLEHMPQDNIFLFGDFLQKCHWYGVEIKKDGKYSVGIVRDKDTFEHVTDSLSNFITYYVQDNEIIY